jgi:hypothetical protein
MRKALLEGQRVALLHILVVVGEQQPVASALGQHVQLDHVHAVRQRRVEAGECVPRLDQVRTLVAHPSHAANDGASDPPILHFERGGKISARSPVWWS